MAWLGTGEIILILILVLILFGPKKLPELGRIIGRGVKEIQKASQLTVDEIMETEDETEKKGDEDKTEIRPIPDELTESDDVACAEFEESDYAKEDNKKPEDPRHEGEAEEFTDNKVEEG